MAEESRDIKVIFSEALLIEDPKERQAYLNEVCKGMKCAKEIRNYGQRLQTYWMLM